MDLDNIRFPLVYPVCRRFEDRSLEDAAAETRRAVEGAGLLDKLPQGAQVAITAGSRGIDRIGEVIREAGRLVKEAGGKPFVFPAMGSHGGATAHGQKALLAQLGITGESVEMPIRSAMETIDVARTIEGAPVYVDRLAATSAGILVINRIKPHTTVVGPHQSGLVKMLAVGMGNRDGAEAFHRSGPADLSPLLEQMASQILPRLPVIGGVGLVEDAFDRLAMVRAAKPANFLDVDRKLLEKATAWMPRLPFDQLDVLVIDEIGKDISGTCMDTNVIGRRGIRLQENPPSPRISRIVALGLTAATRGNAHGVGMADMITGRLADGIDWKATLDNAMTTRFPEKAMLPIAFPTDREAVAAALATCWVPETAEARLVRIRNTRDLNTLLVSESLLPQVKADPSIEITGPAQELFK